MNTDKIFSEFLSFCGSHLGKSKDMIRLVKKRYKDCDSAFTTSEEFVSLMEATKESIQADSKRTFVYLRHFLNKLKAHKLNTEDSKASKKYHASDTVSDHNKHGKGIKRPNDCETEVQSERPLKHPRHELLMKGEPLIDLSADETDESGDSGSEHTDETENHSTDNTNNSAAFKTKTMVSEIPSQDDKTQNILQNWQQFKFKKSVMTSVKAAASSFSDRLSKTISRVSGVQHITEAKVDNIDNDVQYISTLSRSPSPELPEFDLSCKSSQAKSHSGNNDAQKNTSNLADNKYGRNETVGSAEITSTTNLESDACHNKHHESDSKQKKDISNCLGKNSKGLDTAPDKFKESACSDVRLKDLEKDINGYTVEMNVSSDDEVHVDDLHENDSNSNEIEDAGNLNEETVDFTFDSKTHHYDKTLKSDQQEDYKEPNVSSVKAESINSDIQSSKKSSSKIFTPQENVIFLESDDSSSSESEDQKVLMVRNEVDTLFEGSDCEEIDSEQLPVVDSECSKSDHSDNNFSKPTHLKHTDRGISDQIKPKEIHKNGKCESSHSSDIVHCIAVDDDKDERKANGFPAVLGLVSVDKVEKEKTDTKKRQPFITIPSTSRDISNKVKTNYKEEADDEEPEHTKKGKKGSQRQIQMLETLLKQLRDKIEKVRERELSLDELDDEASDYILEDKLQKKFVEVYEKLCKLHKATTRTGRPIDMVFKYEGTRYPEVNRRIMRFINRYKEFPDYRDIRKVIVKVNKDKGLKLRGKAIDELAREAFTDVGNQLQRRRQEDFMSTFTTPFSSTVKTYDDPALYDPDLKRKLEHNHKLAKSRMDTVVEKYTQMQYNVGDKGSSDDESDDDEGPKRMEDGLDIECIGVKDTVPKEGLAKTSRSDRTPLILESSQLEIVNDEEEDIAPYFEDTQIDEEIDPVIDSYIKVQPKNQAYEVETQLQSDGEDESLAKSDNESSLSPDAVKLEMDKVIDIFDEGDEIEIVSGCSDSDQETNTNFDSLNFNDIKVKVERADDAFQSDSIETVNPLDKKGLNTKEVNVSNFDHSLDQQKISASIPSDRKLESIENTSNITLNSENKNNEIKHHYKAVENRVCKADFEKSSKNSHIPSMAVSTLKDTRQDSKDGTTEVDNDLDNLVKQIAADQENSNSSESDVEMKNILDSGAGTTHLSVENIETKVASVTNKTENDEITEIIQNSGSPESEMVCEDNGSLAEKADALGLDDMKEADTTDEIIAADDDPTKLDGRRSPERPHTLLTDKTDIVGTAKMDVITKNSEEEQESLSSEIICTNKKDSVESPDKLITDKTKVTYINKKKEGTCASTNPEIVSAGKVSSAEKPDKYRTNNTKTDEITEAACIVIDSSEDTSENKVKVQKSRNAEGQSLNKLSTNSLQGKKEDIAEDYDSDVEIVDEYNPNDEYYPEDEYNTNEPYSEEMDSQGTYSSKNLNYDDGDYTENSMDCVEISDYPLDSTSTLVDESNLYSNRNYEDEISSTLADTVDIKIPRTVTKERFRAPFVTLKKPIGRKPLVNPVHSSSREDSLDVIEMYSEPDSTPYTDDMVVSSSCQNDIIVLSDSE